LYDFSLNEDAARADFSLRAVDAKNEVIRGLQQKDAMVLIDGVEEAAFEFRPYEPSSGLAVVLAIDVSGSMKGNSLADAVAAARQFLDGLTSRDRVALYTFNNRIRQRTAFVRREQILEKLDSLAADSNTVLYDAIYESISLASIVASDRRAVVVLSDGLDTESRVTLEDCIRFALDTDTPVYTIGLGREKDRKQFRNTLGRLAKVSGGLHYFAAKSSELNQLYDGIRQQLLSDYRLSVFIPEDYRQGATHVLTVKTMYAGIMSEVSQSFRFAIAVENGEVVISPIYLVFFGVGIVLLAIIAALFVFIAMRTGRRGD
jgi:VWFA-related protein